MTKPLKCCAKRGLVCRKLFTQEDPLFLHKIFGLSALASFIYRYGYCYNVYGNLQFDGHWFDWLTMFVHMTLSASSIIFHVLAQRIFDKPMIIWEEYRLHAILFTLRCVSVFAYGTLVPVYYPEFYTTLASRCLLVAVVLAHHLVVDEVTKRYGDKDPNRTTVRSVGKDTNVPLWKTGVFRFYSYYQFAALGSHLIPHVRLADAGFNTVIAIQSSAFLMTLFRKGLIKNYSHAGWYSFCLVLSILHIFRFNGFSLWYPFKIMAAFLCRTQWRINKYYLWVSFAIFSIPTVENYVYNTVADNLWTGDMHKLQEYSMSMPSMRDRWSGLTSGLTSGMIPARLSNQWRSATESLSAIDFGHFGQAQQSLVEADRTSLLASAMFVVLTWYIMTSNHSSSNGLRRSMSNTTVGKYFGLKSGTGLPDTNQERKQMERAMKNSLKDMKNDEMKLK